MYVLRFPPKTLILDYIGAGIGFAVPAAVLVSTPLGWIPAFLFSALLVIFGAFGVRTIRRHLSRVMLTPEGVAWKVFRLRRMYWDSIERIKLRYYGTRGQQRRGVGFMQLSLYGDGSAMTFESNLEGFDLLAWCAARVARANGVSLDPTTAANLQALGIDPDGEGPPPAHVAEAAEELMNLAAQRQWEYASKAEQNAASEQPNPEQ